MKAKCCYCGVVATTRDHVPARKLSPAAPRGQNEGEARRQALADAPPPFCWSTFSDGAPSGKNLVNGVFKRLRPEGAHPGVSDEEDSTSRLHLVLLLSRLFLRRGHRIWID